MIIPICWVRECVVRNVMYLHWLFSGRENASQLREGRTVKVNAFLQYANAGKLGQASAHPSKRLSQAWVPQGWGVGFEVAVGACALAPPSLSFIESPKCSGAFSCKSPPSLPSPPAPGIQTQCRYRGGRKWVPSEPHKHSQRAENERETATVFLSNYCWP